MADVGVLVALAVSLGLMIGLSALRISIGICIPIGLTAFGLLALGPHGFLKSVADGLTDVELWNITISVALVAILGSVMRELGQMDSIARGLRGIGVRGKKLMAIGPAILGLVPIPGGAILSASMVEEEGRRGGADERASATANLLFRHMNLFIYPLSPALIFLASPSMLNTSVYLLILFLSPYFVVHVTSSYIASFHGSGALERGGEEPRGSRREAAIELGEGLLPVLIAPALMAIGFIPAISLCLSLPASLLVGPREGAARKFLAGVKKSKAVSFSSPVLFAMLFRAALGASGASEAVIGLLSALGMPLAISLFLSAFGLGLATGDLILATAIAIPGGTDIGTGALVYSGAVFGYMISPLHLCLMVSAKHLGVRQIDMYPRLAFYMAFSSAASLAIWWPLSYLTA